MNAQWLHLPDGTRTDISICTGCGMPARGESNFDLSERCCLCRHCERPLRENGARPSLSPYHDACYWKHQSEADARRLEKAELVTGYDGPVGPVYCDRVGHGSYGDGYFADICELEEALEDWDPEDGAQPAFAYCCESGPACTLNLDDWLESATEESFEDAIDSLNGVDELHMAVDRFNQLNSSLQTWYPDYKHKVAIGGNH